MWFKLVAVAGLAGVLACAPAAAAGATSAGTFKGKTDRDQPVEFKVTDAGQLTAFSFRRLKLKCSDGDTLRLGSVASGKDKLTITPAGKFNFSVSYDAGDKWTASGTIDGSRAKGKLRFRVRFDADGNAAPDGSVLCDSGRRRFSATLR
jgi:hypothetical protein